MKPSLGMILLLLIKASILMGVTATGCSIPLGMESGDIADNQLSASSSYNRDWVPQEARLNNHRAWYPESDTADVWLQVDLLERTSITGIQTQGHRYSGRSYYVTSYKLLYTDDETDSNWTTVQENGSDKIFQGNTDGNSVKTNTIEPPIVTRFIRLMVVRFRRRIALRLELLGCELEPNPPMGPGIPADPERTTLITSGPVVTSTPYTMTTGNSDDVLADKPAGTTLVAIIGGAVAAGVVIIIIAIVISIFLIRRRRSKDTDEMESSTQPDKTGTTGRIYNNVITFTANGNASYNGDVTIGRSEGIPDGSATIDQSEEEIDDDPYAYAYAEIGDAWADTGHFVGNFPADSLASLLPLGTSNGVYENVPPAPSSGHYQELRPAVYQSLQKY